MAGLFHFLGGVGRRFLSDLNGHNPQAPPSREDQTQPTYTLLSLLASGDVADVHLAWVEDNADEQYLLKIARSRAGNVALNRERDTLTVLSKAARHTTYRKYLPQLTKSLATDDGSRRRVNVFRHEPGLWTLEQVHERHPALDGRHLGWIGNRLLTILGFCHRQRIVHGAVLPCHVLLDVEQHGLRLIGWGQSVAAGRPVRITSARYADRYPPEVDQRRPATPATDLFLTARCLTYLAGDAMPDSMRRFWATCRFDEPVLRPHNAWALMDEFNELLQHLYGAPKFHTLTMT